MAEATEQQAERPAHAPDAWIRRLLLLVGALAATVLLVGILTGTSAGLLGRLAAYPDRASIVALGDACGGPRYLAPARGVVDEQPVAICKGRVDVVVAAPSDRMVYLFVDHRLLATQRSVHGAAVFEDVPVEPGTSRLRVALEDAFLAFPFASRSMPPPSPWPSVASLHLPHADEFLRDPATVLVAFAPGKAIKPRTLGAWTDADGGQWALVQAAPLVELALSGGRTVTDAAGLTVQPLDAASPALGSPAVTRSLQIRRWPTGQVAVDVVACLPPDNFLVSQARAGRLGTADLVARLFAVYAADWITLDDPQWRQARLVTAGTASAAGCIPLTGSYIIEHDRTRGAGDAAIFRGGGASFPWWPGDELVVDGFGQRLVLIGAPPTVIDGDRLQWRGSVDSLLHAGSERLELWPAAAAITADLSKPVDAQAPQSPFATLGRIVAELSALDARALFLGALLLPLLVMYVPLLAQPPSGSSWPLVRQIDGALEVLLVTGMLVAFEPYLTSVVRGAAEAAGIGFALNEAAARDSAQIATLLLPAVVAALVVPGATLGSPAAALQRPLPGRVRLVVLGACVVAVALAAGLLGELLTYGYIDVPARSGLMAWLLELAGLSLPPQLIDESILPRAPLPLALLAAGLWLALLPLLFFVLREVLRLVPLPGDRTSLWSLVVLLALLLFAVVPALVPGVEAAQVATAATPPDPARLVHMVPLQPIFALGLVAAQVLAAALLWIWCWAARLVAPPGWQATFSPALLAAIAVLGAAGIVGTVPGGLPNDAASIARACRDLATSWLAFVPTLGLLAAVTLARALEAARSDPYFAPQHRPDQLTALGAAVFAAYLGPWDRSVPAILVLLLVAYLACRIMALSASPAVPMADAGLARRLMAALGELRLLGERRKAIDAAYGANTLSQNGLERERRALDRLAARIEARLGCSRTEAKARLLDRGPGRGPLANATLGAAVGLVAAAAFLVLRPLVLATSADAVLGGWRRWIEALAAEPTLSLVPVIQPQWLLPSLMATLLNAAAPWVVVGGLFGYLFHRLRGDDGFVKALAFGGALAVPFLLGQVTRLAGGEVVGLDQILRLVPILVFLIVMGTLVFDAATLRRHGLGVTALPDIYGLRTSVGYLSFAGGLAVLTPLLEFIKWVSG